MEFDMNNPEHARIYEMASELNAFEASLWDKVKQLTEHFGKYLLLGQTGRDIDEAVSKHVLSWEYDNENSWRKSIRKNVGLIHSLLQRTITTSTPDKVYQNLVKEYVLISMDFVLSDVTNGMCKAMSHQMNNRISNAIQNYMNPLENKGDFPLVDWYAEIIGSWSSKTPREKMLANMETLLAKVRE